VVPLFRVIGGEGTEKHREQGDVISLLVLVQNKKS
jgi:hypothetical protein